MGLELKNDDFDKNFYVDEDTKKILEERGICFEIPNNIESIKEKQTVTKAYIREDKVDEAKVAHDSNGFKKISKATMKRIYLVLILKSILLIVSSKYELDVYIEKLTERLQADKALKNYLEEFTRQYNFLGLYNTYNITGTILGFAEDLKSKREFQQLKDSEDWTLKNSEYMNSLFTIMEVEKNEFV